MRAPDLLRSLDGQLIVSCQASDGDAFRDSKSMARFAQAAVAGGAKAIRANGAEDIAAIRAAVSVPIIGIEKEMQADGRVLITPSFDAARRLQAAGADMIALDCTISGQRAGAIDRIKQIQKDLGLLALADIATVAEARDAVAAGADAVLSTLRGYTDDTADVTRFYAQFIRDLVAATHVPVIAEGRIHSTFEAQAAIEAGAFAVIIGTAITRPADITRSLAAAILSARRSKIEPQFFAGIDLGGTNVKYGLVSSADELLWQHVAPTPGQQGRDALLECLRNTVARTLGEAAARQIPVTAIGIATAGWVRSNDGSIAYATENLPGWTGTRVAESLAESCRLPVSLEDDANALAIAEKHFGLVRGLNDFVVITLGTGVGGGCYVRGELNCGAHFFANAIGHMPLLPDGLPCTCGHRGCLEVYASESALLRYAGPRFSSAQQVIAAACTGDSTAEKPIETLAGYLARGCASIVGLLDPQAIILSGGLAVDNPLLINSLRAQLEPLVPAWKRRSLEIASSELGYFGGVLGATALARHP